MTQKYRRDCFNSGEAGDSSGDLNGSQSPSRLIENVRISRSRGARKAQSDGGSSFYRIRKARNQPVGCSAVSKTNRVSRGFEPYPFAIGSFIYEIGR